MGIASFNRFHTQNGVVESPWVAAIAFESSGVTRGTQLAHRNLMNMKQEQILGSAHFL